MNDGDKMIRIRTLSLLTLLLTGSNLSFAENKGVTSQLKLEDTCEMALQGKVAWNSKGTVDWGNFQINKLCGTARHSVQPAICFSSLMQGDMRQGNGRPWDWHHAIDLCKQTLNAQQTIDCYQKGIELNGQKSWKNILKECNSITTTEPVTNPVTQKPSVVSVDKPVVRKSTPKKTKTTSAVKKQTPVISKATSVVQKPTPVKVKTTPVIQKPEALSICAQAFEGKVAWDYKNTKIWNIKNLNRLCKGAENSLQPSICFNKAMHGRINWGGGTQWEWINALHLCEGTKNASATISCFIDKIDSGQHWKPAISACNK